MKNNFKKDFPIFNNQSSLVYLDSASTSQKPKQMIEAMADFYSNYNSNIYRGIYDISEKATAAFEDSREKVAKFIGAKSSKNVIFTRNTTEAINLVVHSFADKNIQAGDNIIVTTMEHHGNFVPWQQFCKARGADFNVAPITKEGKLETEELFKLIDSNTKLLALTHSSNVLGTINPVEDIIKKAKAKNPNLKVLVDGAQSVAHLPVNVKDLNCDFLAFSSHKMFGPMGIGVLFASDESLELMEPFLFGGHMIRTVTEEETDMNIAPWKFEAGTQDVAGVIGFGAAIDYLNEIGMENIKAYLSDLTVYSREKLENIADIEIYGPRNNTERVSLFSFNIKGLHSHDLAQFLNNQNIAIRAGHHCAMPLHNVLGIVASARASFHIYNDKEDIDKLAKALLEAINFFKA